MVCPRCGTACLPENKFCKSCGAALGAAGSAQAPAAQPAPPAAAPAAYPAAYQHPPVPPPGMVPMMYQAYPGGPQQVYYVPAQGAHAQGAGGLLEGLNAQIRAIAATDKLEGFSLKQTFGQAFSKHTEDEINDYLVTGSARTTPPLELIDTNWPKPWMFFRVLAILAVAYAAFYGLFVYSQNPLSIPAIMVLGTFAMPFATLMLVWELNTPRNVSIATVLKVVIIGGGVSIAIADLLYLVPIFSNTSNVLVPGFVEETAKILAVVVVTWGATSQRYSYQLNGILFGCAVGAGFACCETLGYGWNAFTQVLIAVLPGAANGTPLGPIIDAATKNTVESLTLRGLLAPFGHVVWCSISAGALWRVKGDKPVSLSMLFDGRFLRAWIIPMAMHDLWDSPICTGGTGLVGWHWGVLVIDGMISWYVLFTMVQQGLHQVRDMKKAQLEHTVAHVEETLGLSAKRFVMPPQAPAGA
jgi:protease PrsW